MRNYRTKGQSAGGVICAWFQRIYILCAFLSALPLAFSCPTARASVAETPAAGAAEPAACRTVRLSEPGWTDISVTTALMAQTLQAIGYKTDVKMLSVPVTFSAMSTGEVDVFLGYWKPSMTADIKPYLDNHSLDVIRVNLAGARYGLAVPQYAYDKGLRSFGDIARFSADLRGKIYGVEPGNDANRIILGMIDKNAEGLGKFTLVESSEQAMLSEVDAAIADKKPIVFLAWQPHPMNRRFKIAYLSGAEPYFGAGENGAAVLTVARKNYAEQCPNTGALLKNISFTMEQENSLMDTVLNQGADPDDAAKAWLKANPAVLAQWLRGVKDVSGGDGFTAAEKALGIKP